MPSALGFLKAIALVPGNEWFFAMGSMPKLGDSSWPPVNSLMSSIWCSVALIEVAADSPWVRGGGPRGLVTWFSTGNSFVKTVLATWSGEALLITVLPFLSYFCRSGCLLGFFPLSTKIFEPAFPEILGSIEAFLIERWVPGVEEPYYITKLCIDSVLRPAIIAHWSIGGTLVAGSSLFKIVFIFRHVS